jgi:hypothetical protein
MGIGYQNLLSRHPSWLPEKFVVPILQFGSEERSPSFPHLPTASELATGAEAKALIGFIEAPLAIAYPFALPNVPGGRSAVCAGVCRRQADPGSRNRKTKLLFAEIRRGRRTNGHQSWPRRRLRRSGAIAGCRSRR